jgi:hypothetical protein
MTWPRPSASKGRKQGDGILERHRQNGTDYLGALGAADGVTLMPEAGSESACTGVHVETREA